MSRLLDCCDSSSSLDGLSCYCLAFLCGLQAVPYRNRHILSGIDLSQPILYFAAAASQHFMEM